jgi:Heparinase II/III-like protein
VAVRLPGHSAAAPRRPLCCLAGVVGLLVLIAVAGCTARPAPHRPAAARTGASHVIRPGSARRPLTAAEKACGSLPSFPRDFAEQIMAGRLTIAPWPMVTIDPRRDGDVNWSIDPFQHPTWVLDFQDGTWMEALAERYLAGGPGAAGYQARLKALLLGWTRDVPIQNQPPETLVCASEAFPGQSWITSRIPVLVNYQAAHWQGAYNHGLQQDLQLLRIGCAYPASAFGGQARTWRQVARQQMIAAFAPDPPNQYGPAVDTQGATNEQATGYANYAYGLWTQGQAQLTACGYSLPRSITSRIGLMPMFLAQATQPDGNLVQIGDTYAVQPRDRAGTPLRYAGSQGAAGTPPAERVAVYQAGYVFGRSTWRPFGGASFYSLRFGPGQQIHGHDDHMSLTYYDRGRNLLVNAGHVGYEDTPYRAYLVSPEASNVLVMPGVPFSPAAATALTSQAIGSDGQFFALADTAFGGHPRERSVYVSQRADLVLVFDRASGAVSYQQLWHLDPGLTVTRVTRSYAVATAAGTQLEIRQIALPGQVIPAGSTQVVRGQTSPYQGWVSRQVLQRTPAPVITMTRPGPSAAILTLIAPSSPGAVVSTAISPQPGGWYQLRVRVGGNSASFLVSAGGDIRQG